MDQTKKQEFALVKKLNNKRICDLEKSLKDLLQKSFPKVSEQETIQSDICNRYSKPDIYIKVGKEIRYISLKSGRSDSMHFENIKTFILFLRELGVSKETQRTILYFHYGDSTLDGTGIKRYSFEELFPLISKRLKTANLELMQKGIIEAALKRFVFVGTEDRKIQVDEIWYGDNNYYLSITKRELTDFVLSKTFKHINTLHIGPMTIQPYLRDVNRKSRNQFKRQTIQVKWHYLLTDIEKIIAKRVSWFL